MGDGMLDGLKMLDRDALMGRMAAELPEIRGSLGVSVDELAEKTGMDQGWLKQIEAGERSMKWSEFMSILFVLWRDDRGRGLVESKGLFPDALKTAMSVNRSAHAPEN